MSFVAVHKLTFSYAPTRSPVIESVTFAMEAGEIVGILGPSGSGKTTILRLIAGLELPDGGSIAVDGKTLVDEATFVPPEERGVGMMFQDYGLFPHLTVAQNVAFGLHRLSRDEREHRRQQMVELVHLGEYERRYPHELSGGQQQRVALARALAPKPCLLLMDEPFSNLDAGLKDSIRGELREILQVAGMTSLVVTHDDEDVQAICHRTITVESLAEE
jgi:iron(III) transport system ATP-binding protein